VLAYQQEGIPLLPLNIHEVSRLYHIYNPDRPVELSDEDLPEAWTNYFRSDDVSATGYFYLDRLENDLPPIQSNEIRTIHP
jgi:hypothetical protein